MIINISKTKELVFQRLSLKHFLAPSAVCGIEQVPSAKLLGVIFKNNLSFDEHVTAVLKCCSQRAYILKLLRDQGMLQIHLDTVFHALIMAKIRYALCAWGGFLTQTQKGMINAFLRRMYKYHFVSECFDLIPLWMTWIF